MSEFEGPKGKEADANWKAPKIEGLSPPVENSMEQQLPNGNGYEELGTEGLLGQGLVQQGLSIEDNGFTDFPNGEISLGDIFTRPRPVEPPRPTEKTQVSGISHKRQCEIYNAQWAKNKEKNHKGNIAIAHGHITTNNGRIYYDHGTPRPRKRKK